MGDQFDETREMSGRDQSSFSRAISVRREIGANPDHAPLTPFHWTCLDSLYLIKRHWSTR